MRFLKYLIILSIIYSFYTQAQQDIREIAAPRLLRALMKRTHEGDSDLIVINVLNPNSYKDCHIKSSINLPMQHLKARAKHRFKSGKWQKNKMIVVYCANLQCPLSRYAYKELVNIGFTNVWAYEGGMHDWMKHHKKYGGYKYPVIGIAYGGYLHE